MHRTEEFGLPAPEHGFDLVGRQRAQHSEKRRLARGPHAPGVRVAIKAERAQLRLRAFAGKGRKIALPAHHVAESGQHDQRDHARHRIRQRSAAAKLRQAPTFLQQAADRANRRGAAHRRVRRDQRPGRRQLQRAQLLAGAFDECLHPELLWPLVRFVETLACRPNPEVGPNSLQPLTL